MANRVRGDIQGLRAVAVLTVIAAHTGIPGLTGGYVGVDVFFVVSGYLISHLLFAEVERTGRLSLAGFWARRARRILPAATLVTVATLAASLVYLSLVDARQVVTDAGWATAFAANLHFAADGVDYFAQDQGPSPLQHYWSLSVEEQFYLVWPLLLAAVVLAARGQRRRTALPRRDLAVVLAVATVASFTWSVVQTGSNPVAAYFSTLTRAWELGLGALTALVAPRLVRALSRRALGLLTGAGLAAIAVACLTFTTDTPFPGPAAALPVVGTALVLLAGAGRHEPTPNRWLGLQPLRTVGDWSYSLYLWHWPVLVLAERHLGRSLTGLETGSALLATFALAGATYTFVETPFRTGRPARVLTVPRAVALYPACVALVAVACAGSWWWTEWRGGELGHDPAVTVGEYGAPPGADRTVALVRASVLAARDHRPVPSDLTPDVLSLRDSVADVGDCDYTSFPDIRDLCPRGNPDGERTLVVTGDSHARAWIPAFEEIARHDGWKAYYLVKPQCTAARVTVGDLEEGKPWADCDEFHDWVLQQVANLDPDLVVVASSPPVNGVWVDGNHLLEEGAVSHVLTAGYDDLFDRLTDLAPHVALIRDVPKSPEDPATCLTTGDPDLGDCLFRPLDRSRTLGAVPVRRARAHGVEVTDPTRWLCWDGSCPIVVGSTITYRDVDHLTTEYAATLAEPLGRDLGLWSR
ncbi:acyltransferase family protein [Nocardioides sp. LS1]|uniref:acyltransferase family protein n=1 Tax=Nocardioides sp. LS1 TaxID=1027620 RepID=UPI000F61EAD5|nr:acyltransferase family protein [Nocardioides sp. LS1]GCD92167.1 acyltransferase [Nocardioides sp. LS1]